MAASPPQQLDTPRAGPLTARLYLRGLALVSLVAWLSIGGQLLLLVGAGGLLPIAPLLDEARRQDLSALELPTLFWISASDRVLVGAVALGAAASLFGLLRPSRWWLGLSLPLYLSVCIAAQDFCSFQWDLLLLEASFLALFLDPREPTRAALWMPRLLLVKLYVESGISKLLSPLGDWLSGAAMTAYFETAPLPTPLARWFHALPPGALHVVTWLVLVIELSVPLLAFGPRPLRRAAFVVLTGFQLVNFMTAGYGFFAPLTIVLHLALLDDALIARLRLGRAGEAASPSRRARIVTCTALAMWVLLSLAEAQLNLARDTSELLSSVLLPLRRLYAPLRIIGTYHLFASVTVERVEPIFEVRITDDPNAWTELALRYKPGPLDRPPPFVAPHQPRVDFQLWFHGLRPTGRLPAYVQRIEALLCDEPARLSPLFATPLPAHPIAARIRYARYHFTPPGEANAWTREPLGARPERVCGEESEESARR